MNIELELITACINHERKAEYELYKITYSYLMGVCFRYTNSREDAEENMILALIAKQLLLEINLQV